uniref:(northern house mosquito) hypothetical protein n=1 Tax=Culex pipiens TaxID=7175 RepID=A0A8D8K6P2_CULPI
MAESAAADLHRLAGTIDKPRRFLVLVPALGRILGEVGHAQLERLALELITRNPGPRAGTDRFEPALSKGRNGREAHQLGPTRTAQHAAGHFGFVNLVEPKRILFLF